MSDDLYNQRLNKANELIKLGHNPYENSFVPNSNSVEINEHFDRYTREDLEAAHTDPNIVSSFNDRFKIAGRVIFFRRMGKLIFIKIMDPDIFQIVIKADNLNTDAFNLAKKYIDIGDIIGVTGFPMRTMKGELSIAATDVKILTKALRPLPDKWHGLTDIEARYRQRYLDLICNPESRNVLIQRSQIVNRIREYLNINGYLEVETPMLHPIAGGAAAKPFVTHHNTLDMDLFLRIAPELYLKRLVVGGFSKVFEINRNFRNEGISTVHNPEFTTVELYSTYSTYKDLMDLCQNIIKNVIHFVTKKYEVEWNNNKINLNQEFKRLSMLEAISLHGGPSEEECRNEKIVKERLGLMGVDIKNMSHGKMVLILFEHLVEENLIQPTFIYDFPTDVSPLARRKDNDPWLVERFELFIGGHEIANAFSELNDPVDQSKRFEQQLKERAAGDEEAVLPDYDYIKTLESGMPPTAGLGIGIDRLVMLLTGSNSIRDVILFPLMRPEPKG
jgi:lysyl-tRNA synthetase class 2